MRIRRFYVSAILLFILLVTGCTKKPYNNPGSPDVVSWIKPIAFVNENIAVVNLTKKGDDGYLACGYTYYMDKTISHGFVINLNSDGDSIWCRKIDMTGYPNNVILYAAMYSNNGFIVAGLCSYASFKLQRFIAWLDPNGNITKSILFPIADNQVVNDCKLIPLEDGTIYYAVNMRSTTDQSFDGYILSVDLLDKDGQLLRSRSLTGIQTGLDHLNLVDNGKLLLVGSVAGQDPDYSDFLFLLIDGSGNEIYRRTFGSTTYDFGYSSCSDHKGGYIVSGMTGNLSKPVLYPVNASGIVETGKAVADTLFSTASIIKTSADNGYNLFIQTNQRIYFMKLGSDLTVKHTYWMNYSFDPVLGYNLRDVIPLSDGSFSFLYYSGGPVIIKTIPLN
jgi:hypothetical protein